MTETLQHKIDAMLSKDPKTIRYHNKLISKSEVDKAIRELREEIKHLGAIEAFEVNGEKFYWVRMQNVLALIGEKK